MTPSPRGAVIRDVAKLVEPTLQCGMPDVDTVLGELTESVVAARHAGSTVASRRLAESNGSADDAD